MQPFSNFRSNRLGSWLARFEGRCVRFPSSASSLCHGGVHGEGVAADKDKRNRLARFVFSEGLVGGKQSLTVVAQKKIRFQLEADSTVH